MSDPRRFETSSVIDADGTITIPANELRRAGMLPGMALRIVGIEDLRSIAELFEAGRQKRVAEGISLSEEEIAEIAIRATREVRAEQQRREDAEG